VTVAQLVHPVRGLVRHSRRPPLHALRRAAFRRWSCNAILWRAILTGLGFAVIGLLMMVLALDAAGVASPTLRAPGDAPVVVSATPDRRLEIYQNPADALSAAMPVP